MTESTMLNPTVKIDVNPAVQPPRQAVTQLERQMRRAIAAEDAFVAAAAQRARLVRQLECLQITLAEIADVLSASEQRRGEAEADTVRLRARLAQLEAKRNNKKKRSVWWMLRKRLKRLLSSTARDGQRPTNYAGIETTPAAAAVVTSTIQDGLRQRFEALDPLRTYPELRGGRRVTIVTDSVNPGLLYGGVATAILLGTLAANRIGADLRIVTRHHEADPSQVGALLASFGLKLDGTVGCVFSPPRAGADVPVFAGDIFLTTSWWTTQAILSAVDPRQVVYLLQEDERMFYPRGDERLRCSEILNNDSIHFVVNTELLFRHFARGEEPLPNIAARGCWFEPAFLKEHYFDEPQRRRQRAKKTFLFYARPNNLRNMYWRGLEAIGVAIEEGILAPEDWEVVFVGRDLEPVALPRGVRPRLVQNLPWAEYAALIRGVDLGLSLIDTPHPSYPPLDMAASGAVVVTNRCGTKTSLDRYSDNIVCVEPSVVELRDGLRRGAAIVADEPRRAANYLHNQIPRDWAETLEEAVRFSTALGR